MSTSPSLAPSTLTSRPSTFYRARTKTFTAVQLALLGAMWWVKSTSLGLFFPVLIGLLAPIRIAMERFGLFSKAELEALDGEIA